MKSRGVIATPVVITDPALSSLVCLMRGMKLQPLYSIVDVLAKEVLLLGVVR